MGRWQGRQGESPFGVADKAEAKVAVHCGVEVSAERVGELMMERVVIGSKLGSQLDSSPSEFRGSDEPSFGQSL